MKKRRMKNTLKHGYGKPQKQPKGSYGRKTDEDGSDFAASDVDSDDFYHDEIDDFHADEEKMLLGDEKSFNTVISTRQEEEIMPITDEEDEGDLEDEQAEEEFEDEDAEDSFHKSDMESDLDDKSDEDDGLPSLSAWGKKKSMYYGADFVDKDRGKSYRLEDEEKAEAELDAGAELQSNFFTYGGHGMLILDDFSAKKQEFGTVAKELTGLSQDDQKQHLKKESPELYWLADDFWALMKELREHISPLLKLVEDGQITGKGAEYLKMKQSLIEHYCKNIFFYMMLKINGTPVKHHPVLKRLTQYRKTLNQYEETNKKVKLEIDYMLEKLKAGESIEFEIQNEHEEESSRLERGILIKHSTSKRPAEEDVPGILKKSKKQKVEKTVQFETETENEISELYMTMKKKKQKEDAKLLLSSDDDEFQDEDDIRDPEDFDNGDDDDDAVADGKRTITYEIAKNKGLLPYRKKEYRNPRVRNRMKYRRAKIRRKGQVREPRKELTRYGGELTGIRTDVSKSIKIK